MSVCVSTVPRRSLAAAVKELDRYFVNEQLSSGKISWGADRVLKAFACGCIYIYIYIYIL